MHKCKCNRFNTFTWHDIYFVRFIKRFIPPLSNRLQFHSVWAFLFQLTCLYGAFSFGLSFKPITMLRANAPIFFVHFCYRIKSCVVFPWVQVLGWRSRLATVSVAQRYVWLQMWNMKKERTFFFSIIEKS